MLRVFDCITGDHDFRYVVVAGLICLFGCFAAVSLLSRALTQDGAARRLWLAAAAFVGGGGIWATHFVAMLAYRPVVPVTYDIGLTVLSIAFSVGFTGLGFDIAAAGGRRAAAGGLLAGFAVALMHFTGMSAIRGPVHVDWLAVYVVTAIAVGAVFSVAALALAVGKAQSLAHRVAASTLYATGICGLHFIGMAALSLTFDPQAAFPPQAVNRDAIAIAVVAVTVLIVGVGLAGSIFDRHLADRSVREADRLRAYIAELTETKNRLEDTTETLGLALDRVSASSQAKSQFLAAMSHELRTPLNAVIGFSGMISNQVLGPVGNREYVTYAEAISTSGSHLLSLINDILDLSSLDAGALSLNEEAVHLAEIVHEAARILAAQAGAESVSIRLDIPATLPAVVADRRRMRQVVLNLLSNAVKFTPPGGDVFVTGSQDERGLSFTIRDTGIGIAAEDIPRALERFVQVDSSLSRRYDGTGLGLPLSRDLVVLHGGTFEIESTVGAGTLVTFTLPASRVVTASRVA